MLNHSNARSTFWSLVCTGAALLAFAGCGDNAQENKPQAVARVSSSGIEVTSPNPNSNCPHLTCAAPPAGCTFQAPSLGSDGCPADCGSYHCLFDSCPVLTCAAPPAGCNYGAPYARDAQGCISSCGTVSCLSSGCPYLTCAAPPAGCRYAPPYLKDSHGCLVSCGTIVCG